MSKHSVTIRGLRVVTTCWSCVWSNHTSPSKWVGMGSPVAACSVYGDLTYPVPTVNNLCTFNCQCHFCLCNQGPYVRLAFVPNTLSFWNKIIIIIIIIIRNYRHVYISIFGFFHIQFQITKNNNTSSLEFVMVILMRQRIHLLRKEHFFFTKGYIFNERKHFNFFQLTIKT